jgi:hypothetical protein
MPIITRSGLTTELPEQRKFWGHNNFSEQKQTTAILANDYYGILNLVELGVPY